MVHIHVVVVAFHGIGRMDRQLNQAGMYRSAHALSHDTWPMVHKCQRMDQHTCIARTTIDRYNHRSLHIHDGSHGPYRMHCLRSLRSNSKLQLRYVLGIQRLVHMVMGCMVLCQVHVVLLLRLVRIIDEWGNKNSSLDIWRQIQKWNELGQFRVSRKKRFIASITTLCTCS